MVGTLLRYTIKNGVVELNSFELLEKEIIYLCKINDIDFRWRYCDSLDNYELTFRKSDRGFKLTISNLDLHIKPFSDIKAEIEHAIYEVIGYQPL